MYWVFLWEHLGLEALFTLLNLVVGLLYKLVVLVSLLVKFRLLVEKLLLNFKQFLFFSFFKSFYCVYVRSTTTWNFFIFATCFIFFCNLNYSFSLNSYSQSYPVVGFVFNSSFIVFTFLLSHPVNKILDNNITINNNFFHLIFLYVYRKKEEFFFNLLNSFFLLP